MRDYEKHTIFLKTLIHHQSPSHSQDLKQKMTDAVRNERSIRRAIFAVIILGLLSLCGIAYSAVLVPEFFQSQTLTVVKVFCTTGLTSLLSLVGFIPLWVHCRSQLRLLHEECRTAIMGSLNRTTPTQDHTQVYQIQTLPAHQPPAELADLPKAS